MLSLPLGHPTRAPLSDHRASSLQPRLPFRKQTPRLWHPSGILSGFRGASGGQQSYPTLLCGAPAAAGSEASEGPAPGHQGAARAPHSPASSGACGSLTGENCAAPEPRAELLPKRVPPPTADCPYANGFPEPTAATTSFAASQNGRRPAPQVRVPEGAGLGS